VDDDRHTLFRPTDRQLGFLSLEHIGCSLL
jgi:hypothetical protein